MIGLCVIRVWLADMLAVQRHARHLHQRLFRGPALKDAWSSRGHIPHIVRRTKCPRLCVDQLEGLVLAEPGNMTSEREE